MRSEVLGFVAVKKRGGGSISVENLGELEGMKISPSIRLATYQGVRHLSKP